MRVISEGIADASALKMCYGALNKGTQALWLEVLIAAQRLGVAGLLEQQLQQSQADRYDWALSQFPILPPKAYRWVPEMLEISKTLGAAGVTPEMFQGAADIYRFVAGDSARQGDPGKPRQDAAGQGCRAIVGSRANLICFSFHSRGTTPPCRELGAPFLAPAIKSAGSSGPVIE